MLCLLLLTSSASSSQQQQRRPPARRSRPAYIVEGDRAGPIPVPTAYRGKCSLRCVLVYEPAPPPAPPCLHQGYDRPPKYRYPPGRRRPPPIHWPGRKRGKSKGRVGLCRQRSHPIFVISANAQSGNCCRFSGITLRSSSCLEWTCHGDLITLLAV